MSVHYIHTPLRGETGGARETIGPFLPARTLYRPKVILGPPGTGKTHALLEQLERELSSGVSPERIAFVTFTRAARLEALNRVRAKLGFSEAQLPWIRTIHSTAYRLQGVQSGRIFSDDRWAEFAERHDYQLSNLPSAGEDPDFKPISPPRRTKADLARYVWAWGRSRGLSADDSLKQCPVEGLRADYYKLFVRRLHAFKRLEALIDFDDLLESTLRVDLRPDVDVSFVDEAQDLSPVQSCVCEHWFGPCARSYVAGDDDQAIYGFQGADPAWLSNLAKAREPIVLGQSRRVPATVHQFAQRIIRQNRDRMPKRYEPRDEVGAVMSLDLDEALRLIPSYASTFILARNRMYLHRPARELMTRGVPYLVEGDGAPCPLARTGLREGLAAAKAWLDGEPVRGSDLVCLLGLVKRRDRLVPDSVRRQVEKAAAKAGTLTDDECKALGLGALLSRVMERGATAAMTALPPASRRYIALLIREYGELPEPAVTLNSIHGAKGQQAKLVIVIGDMTCSTYDGYGRRQRRHDYEAENRVFYVAVTRAEQTVVLAIPRGRRHYLFPQLPRPATSGSERPLSSTSSKGIHEES